MQFKDYPPQQIADKLKQVEDFERQFGENTTTKAWRKWCTDYNYRKREWRFRQGIAASIKPNINYLQ